MKKLNWATIVLDLIYMALGILFIIHPEGVESVLCYILAASVAVIGLLYLIGHFLQKPAEGGYREGSGFVMGILLIILAVFIISKQNLVISLVPFLFGVMVLVRGLMILQNLFYMRYLGIHFGLPLGTGLLNVVLGLFVMLFPFETATLLFIIIGIGLLAGGISGIISEVMTMIHSRRREHELERARDMEGARTVRVKTYRAEDGTDADALEEPYELDEPGEADALDAPDAPDHAKAGTAISRETAPAPLEELAPREEAAPEEAGEDADSGKNRGTAPEKTEEDAAE